VPSTDKHVIQIDTLVIGNGARASPRRRGSLRCFTYVFPDFVRVNRERPNLTGLRLASAASSYYEDGGPDKVGAYVPWVIDIMPTARWLQLAFAISLLFGARPCSTASGCGASTRNAFTSKARCRVCSTRDHGGRDSGDGAGSAPRPDKAARIDALIAALGVLAERCRRQSLSFMVPMGQEMGTAIRNR
jgi:hypothetical protein